MKGKQVILPVFYKHEDENFPIGFDLVNWLESGESINGISVAVSPVGLTLPEAAGYTGTKVYQRISGGTVDTRYELKFTVTTDLTNTYIASYIVEVVSYSD